MLINVKKTKTYWKHVKIRIFDSKRIWIYSFSLKIRIATGAYILTWQRLGVFLRQDMSSLVSHSPHLAHFLCSPCEFTFAFIIPDEASRMSEREKALPITCFQHLQFLVEEMEARRREDFAPGFLLLGQWSILPPELFGTSQLSPQGWREPGDLALP